MKAAILTLALAIFMLGASAATNEGTYRSYMVTVSPNLQFCKEYVSVMTTSGAGNAMLIGGFAAWARGYLSAMNAAEPNTYDIRGRTAHGEMMYWFQRYCEKHPKALFVEAVDAFGVWAYPNRFRTKP